MKISGHSDDIVCIEPSEHGEVGAIDQDVRIIIGSAFTGGIVVVTSYAPDDCDAGCWQARVSPIDEDVPCPWPVTVSVERYTAVVDVACPSETPIDIARRKQGTNRAAWAQIASDE